MSPLSVSLKGYRPPRKYTYKLITIGYQAFCVGERLNMVSHKATTIFALKSEESMTTKG